jgi:hypothetical protein
LPRFWSFCEENVDRIFTAARIISTLWFSSAVLVLVLLVEGNPAIDRAVLAFSLICLIIWLPLMGIVAATVKRRQRASSKKLDR